MAKEAVAEKPIVNTEAAPSGSGDVVSMTEDTGIEYLLDKNVYHRVSCGSEKDLIYGRYKIEIAKPLPKLDTTLGKAYAVTDASSRNTEDFYAIVLDKRYPVRLAEINRLLGRNQKGFANVLALQTLPLSLGKGRFFTLILDRPKGIALSEYLAKNGAVSEDAVIRHIIPQIHHVISFLYSKKVVHGRINLDNIYIETNGTIFVGECVSEPSGCSQPIGYESLHRASCFTLGKGIGHIGVTDYHALGVLSLIMIRGRDPFNGLTDEEILEIKFTVNTYKHLTYGLEISDRLLDFLRGVVNDKSKDVWTPTSVDEWLKGRKFNLLPPAESADAGRPIVFSNKKYWSKKFLAHGLFAHWDEAKRFIRGDTLKRWVERSVQETDISEKMDIYAARAGGGEPGSVFDRDDELLAQYILLLDKDGPIRLRGFSAMADGVSVMLADGFAKENKECMESVRRILTHGMASYIEFEKPDPTDPKTPPPNPTQDAAFLLQRGLDFLRKRDVGFGLERCLYELSPTLSCQSKLVQDDVVFAMPDLLRTLDNDSDIEKSALLVDHHMAAFLSMRLELHVRIRITSLNKFPDFAADINIQNTALLSLAQQTCGIENLANLGKKVVTSLAGVVDTFHSRFVREEMKEMLDKVAAKGSAPLILKTITSTDLLVRDRLGFRRAVKQYRNNKIQILRLSNRIAVNNMGYRYGLQLSVMLSFFIAAFVLVVLIMKAF